MIHAIKLLAVPVVGLALFAGLFSASAQAQVNTEIRSGLAAVGNSAGFQDTGDGALERTLGRLIQVLLGVLGIVFLVLTLYAGGLWMTAAGNTDNVEKAKKLLVQAVIGLIIILSAYAISEFVISALLQATTGTG